MRIEMEELQKENNTLRKLLGEALGRLYSLEDEGPTTSYGWQSDELKLLIKSVEDILNTEKSHPINGEAFKEPLKDKDD